MSNKLKLPIVLRALGDEVRALQDYFDRGLITQEEADERLADWDLFYPPGFWDIEVLASVRRQQQFTASSQQYAEAAE
jgi:hypothetical protein